MNLQTCTTCTRDFATPYRRYDKRGRVIEGCVDACHTGQLPVPSESNRWYNRPAAKAIRKQLKQMRCGK